MNLMNENRYEDKKYFGFKLDQTSSLILFFLSLTALISYISIIYRHIVDLLIMEELILSLISFIFILTPLPILFYTLLISLKVRNKHLNYENKGRNWFGFEMNNTSTTILFLISILGLGIFLLETYGNIFSIILMWDFYNGITSLSLTFRFLIPRILDLIRLIILALIYIYTVHRCLQIKKKTKREDEISSIKNSNKAKIFGFILDKTSAPIIFIHIIIAILNSPIFPFISFFTYDPIPLDSLLLSMPSLISILILLGLYIYSLVSCVNLRKFHLNNKTEAIKLFGFGMNKTSVCILYLGSILGLISFISTMLGFVNDFISYLNFSDNPYAILKLLQLQIIGLIVGIILMLIHIYTLRRCVKVRKLLI